MASPMTVGILGTGTVASKAALALLEDLTEVADPISFVFAADQANWTDTAQDIAEFIAENEVPFTLVVDDEADPGDDFKEAAQTVVKVARPGIGVVRQLERAEGEKRLVVLFSEDDEDGLKAIERAIDKGIPALDLTAGLEPLVFGDDVDQPAAADDDDDSPAVLAEEPAEKPKRKRRTKAEMEAARAAEAAAKAGDEPLPDDEQVAAQEAGDDDEDEPRRAEHSMQDDLDSEGREGREVPTAYATVRDAEWAERSVRDRALDLAISFHSSRESEAADVVKTAHLFRGFLTDQPVQTTPGRPRADGSPAQPRERDDDGKPVRRRRASSED